MGIYKNGIESKMSGAISHMQKSIHKFIPACLISNGIYNQKKNGKYPCLWYIFKKMTSTFLKQIESLHSYIPIKNVH
jgi:hypothetical protein